MSLSRTSHKQLQEAMSDFGVQLMSNEPSFQTWFMKNVTLPSTKYPDCFITEEAMKELYQMLEKRLRREEKHGVR